MLNTSIIAGRIVLISGLHIGGSKDTMQIGGIDSPIVKNPLDNMPYIPGSSLKGKIRFLLEHYLNLIMNGSGEIPVINKENKIYRTAVIFGHTKHEIQETKPTRVIFTDSKIIGILNKDGSVNQDVMKNETIEFVEAKTEVMINRITGTQGGGLRNVERVPAGVVFDLNIILKQYDDETDKGDLDIILKGLKLLENDALGGSGSRGSGRIEFRDLTVNGAPLDLSTVEI